MRNDLSIRALRLFLRLAATASFSETARLEHVSQPALSRTIRVLEDQLQVRLFDRNTRNVGLSEAGAQLLPVAERLVADHDSALRDLAQSFSGERGRVVVGALPSVAASLLPLVLARFSVERPRVDVRVVDALSDPLVAMLQERRIDFAITIAPADMDGLEFRPLITDPFVLVFHRGDSLDGTDPMAWADLEQARFVAMAQGSSVRQATDKAFAQAGVSVRPLYQCAQLSTMAGFIRAGLGVSAVPVTTLRLIGSDGLGTRPLIAPDVVRSIGIVTLAARSVSRAAEALADGFARHTAEPAPAAGD